ncbi:MAG: hypothetical protein EOP77_00130 [Variovorax sp.]|nr:MAG: hypothetical protein EOP77_00130 [Variovorax sp.]
MNDLDVALLKRAEAAVGMLTANIPRTDHAAKAFVDAALSIARASNPEVALGALQRSPSELLTKAAAHSSLDEVWQGSDMRGLALAYIQSVSEPDLLSAIARYARVIPRAANHVLIATGAVGNVIAEGFPKLIKRLDLTLGGDLPFAKSVAAVVVTQELLSATGDAGRRLFETELAKAVVRAANGAVIETLVDSNTTPVAAGADPLASLRAGLMAAGPSSGFVVTAPAGQVAWLATSDSNRGGMSIRGGTFVPGVEIVALDNATTMTVIPADRLAIWDGGMELRPAGHASVDMSDSPTATGSKVSLWQVNAVGLLVERLWRIEGDTTGIVIVGGS